MTYLSQLIATIVLGFVAGFIIIDLGNYTYKFKGQKHIGWIRLAISFGAVSVGLFTIFLLNLLGRDENDVLLAFTPVVMLFLGVFCSWDIFRKNWKGKMETN